MKLLCILALVTVLFSPTIAKQKPNSDTYRPVSSYMRNVGLLYREQVDGLQKDDDFDRRFDSRDAWEKHLGSLEDRITITLSESRHPSGDEPFFKMLKNARFAHFMYMSCFEDCSLWKDSNFFCLSRAHAIALDGMLRHSYFQTCDDYVNAAMAHDEQNEHKK